MLDAHQTEWTTWHITVEAYVSGLDFKFFKWPKMSMGFWMRSSCCWNRSRKLLSHFVLKQVVFILGTNVSIHKQMLQCVCVRVCAQQLLLYLLDQLKQFRHTVSRETFWLAATTTIWSACPSSLPPRFFSPPSSSAEVSCLTSCFPPSLLVLS